MPSAPCLQEVSPQEKDTSGQRFRFGPPFSWKLRSALGDGKQAKQAGRQEAFTLPTASDTVNQRVGSLRFQIGSSTATSHCYAAATIDILFLLLGPRHSITLDLPLCLCLARWPPQVRLPMAHIMPSVVNHLWAHVCVTSVSLDIQY